MDKQLFDDAIGEVPPSTVDVDAAIARGRRAAWARRVANPMVAVAAGVVLVTGGAIVLTLPNGDDPVTAAQVQPTTTTTETMPTSPAEVCEPQLDHGEGQRLTEALMAALEARGLLMDAALTGDEPLEFIRLYAAPDAQGSCLSFHASAEVNGVGGLIVTVGVARQVPAEPEVTESEVDGGVRVEILRPDSTAITLTAVGTPPPLTVEQLTEVGLDPALTL